MTYVSGKLRKLVFERASGRCEYCLIAEDWFFLRHQIDHIIAEKHGGSMAMENLALCCTLCNRYKGVILRLLMTKLVRSFHFLIRALMTGEIIFCLTRDFLLACRRTAGPLLSFYD